MKNGIIDVENTAKPARNDDDPEAEVCRGGEEGAVVRLVLVVEAVAAESIENEDAVLDA
jgi:hypothetical protein